MYILDSSAIALIIKRQKRKAVEILDGKTTLDLARYELGNIIWKQCTLKGLISQKEATYKAADIAKILEFTNTEKIVSSEDFKRTMMLATNLNLTFYDAAYLQTAKNNKLILVTEDKELNKKAEKTNIKTITVDELLKTSPPTKQ